MTEGILPLRPIRLGLSLGTFLVVVYVACLALALIFPDANLHRPWLQFLPGFTWTWQGLLFGLIESFAYGFFSGVIFAPIYNFFNRGRHE